MKTRDRKKLEKLHQMTVKDAIAILDSGKGIYGDKYHKAGKLMADFHRHDPVPLEFQKSGFIESDGEKCEITYNYVRPYALGLSPCNTWMGVAEMEYKGNTYIWREHLNETVTTFEEACEAMQPLFDRVISRAKKRAG